MLRYLLLLLIYFCFFCALIAQNASFYFHQITIEDNLTVQNLNYYIYNDSKDYVWISSPDGLNKFNGREIQQYQPIRGDSTSIRHTNIISNFYEDKNGNIWFSTFDAIHRYKRKENNFEQIPLELKGQKLEGSYYLLAEDSTENNLWFRIKDSLFVLSKEKLNKPIFIGKYPMNIFCSLEKDQNGNYTLFAPKRNGLFIQQFRSFYETKRVENFFPNYQIKTIHFVDKENIWIGTNKGLLHFNLETLTHKLISNSEIENINDITSISARKLIIGTQNKGLFFFDVETNLLEKIYQFDGLNIKPFLHPIDRIYLDRNKILWVSTAGRGIFFTSLSSKKIDAFFQNKEGESGAQSFIRAITEDENGDLWSLNQDGINVLKLKDKNAVISDEFTGQKVPFSKKYPYFIFKDNANNIWASDHYAGLHYLTSQSEKFEKAKIKDNLVSQSPGITIINEFQQEIYVASTKGIFKWNEKNKILDRVNGLGYEGGTFSWIAQNPKSNQILFRKAQNSFLIGHFQQDTFQLDTTINFKPFINYLHHDTLANRYWLATSEGLHWIDYEGSQYELKEDTVLLHKTLMGVLREDDSDNLWLSSNRGIIKYNFKTGVQRVYGLVDGVQSLEFNFFASYKSKSGKLMFGGVNGLNIFDPKTIKDDAKPASPTITSILINDEPPKTKLICEKTKNKNISYIEHLEFPHDKNTLSFNFAALDYVNPDANQFRYRMKGLDEKWVFSDTKNFARYANLPFGNHVFEVDATNSDGVWSENPAQLRITICPPWYLTWYAYLAYFVIGVCSLLGIYRFQINQRLKQAEAHRLKELDLIKTALYTNITHEFRTPLTIILGMADQIKNKPQKGFQQGLEMIRRSGQNLLNLVNQMLDLSKVESGNMQPQYVQGDIIQFLEYIVESFQSFAASKHIKVTFYNEVSSLMMDYDTDKLQTIVTNLLSNATKFTPEKGTIIVHVQQIKEEKGGAKNWCQLKIKDNGIGIDKKDLPHIFDRFYQIDDSSTRHSGGTGIGLALTKELVELMEGSIKVQSQLNKGTEFTIVLPIRQTAAFAKAFSKEQLVGKLAVATEETILLAEEEATDNTTLPLVLIIEDNLDVITYLQACLEEQYRVSIALDGQAGIEKALEIIPDIIITDVMMPLKDGYEVCEMLKAAEHTSHIPIIMLTAKAQIEAKIEGLLKGADAYLSKPFHQKELEVRLAQLLAQRKRLQVFYSQQTIAPFPKIEDPFIQKVIDLIESDLTTNLNVEQFCQALAMSRAQVFRKIKAMTGFSTSIFIRRIRLKNGHRLLLTTHLNVAEIAYSVGFKDPAYFSRLFSEVYEQSPVQLRASQEKE